MRRPTITRRSLLAGSGAFALSACVALDRTPRARRDLSALDRDPGGILDLPPGFSYRVLHRVGRRMSDDHRVPGRPDGMACFEGKDDTLILMRNHELWESHEPIGAYFEGQASSTDAYDPAGTGCVTRLVLDAESGELLSSNLVLAGTFWNCAGGSSPWGWLSCEETVQLDHGYVFVCPIDADATRPAQRIDGYGRFRHEAGAVDPATHIAYLTEDRPDACFYRFVPDDPIEPFEGTLQALRVRDQPGLDTAAGLGPGSVRVDWVDIAEPTPDDDSVRAQARAAGAAVWNRTEGLWLAGDAAFISATNGGHRALGQVFKLDLERDELELIADPDDVRELDMPDNLCVSPDGLLYVAEDGLDLDNALCVLAPSGHMLAFAHPHAPVEIAGPCFSPDGQKLFVNLQEQGLTLAIEGPFAEVLERTAPRSGKRPAPSSPSSGTLGELASQVAAAQRRATRRPERTGA